MEVGAWDWTLVTVMQLVVAIITFLAVIAALFIGVSSLIQTKRLKHEDIKQRMLNEIIEWAECIVECSWPKGQQPKDFMEDFNKIRVWFEDVNKLIKDMVSFRRFLEITIPKISISYNPNLTNKQLDEINSSLKKEYSGLMNSAKNVLSKCSEIKVNQII